MVRFPMAAARSVTGLVVDGVTTVYRWAAGPWHGYPPLRIPGGQERADVVVFGDDGVAEG